MDRGALQNALEVRRWLGIVAVGGNKVGELVIDVVQTLATQPLDLDTAGAQHGDGVLILGQRKQQMLKRGIFVPALVGAGDRRMKRLSETARQHADPPFTSRIATYTRSREFAVRPREPSANKIIAARGHLKKFRRMQFGQRCARAIARVRLSVRAGFGPEPLRERAPRAPAQALGQLSGGNLLSELMA